MRFTAASDPPAGSPKKPPTLPIHPTPRARPPAICSCAPIQNSIAAVRRTVLELARDANLETIAIACTDGMIVYRQRPLLGASMSASRLIELL
jgi:hypothetical protein